MSDGRRGMLLGVAAYAMWGLFPLYFPLLEPSGPVEILAQRLVWSLLTMLVVVAVLRRGRGVLALVRDRRSAGLLAVAACAISLNWGVYIGGVVTGHVVETALGYYINPLVTVGMGVLVLGERLRLGQWVAIALVVAAVAVLTVGYGRPPWIALVLAFSFATYGLLKKTVSAGAVESLTVETGVLFLPALAVLAVLGVTGQAQAGSQGFGHALLFTTTGLVTAVPLLCFGAATTRLSLSTIGLLQYLTPTIQFLIGVLVEGEAMPTSRWIGFALVWAALVVLSVEALRHQRGGAQRATTAPSRKSERVR
ncbi:EamA family transporter RarD [Nocardioides sp. GY 10127]|uniref:EamA family transporter RarD n=1 Tax=Nocardioides sp. GY 10127 TaxID=2569762 RepID=UPI00197CC9F1|nr:EamA family transporter RarD [Nocardioides sp. GY 10127]